jgi:diguanylate cyclase (GGDEF)-like protein/PAS domain S-box-containing protein
MTPNFKSNSMSDWRHALVWPAAILFLLVLGTLLAWNTYDDYQKTLNQEYRTLESQARLGDVQVSGALRSINLILQSVIDDTQARPKLSPQVIQQRQESWLRQFPEIYAVLTVDRHGQVVTAESLDNPDEMVAVRSFNASQREYFTVHRDAKPEDYFRYQISRPYKTITHLYSITVSRSIRSKDGQFQGVALVTLSPRYFDAILQQVLSSDELDAAALHNRDGDIIYRVPNPDRHIGKNIASGDAFKAYLASDQQFTHYLGVTVTDNVKRVLVFSKVAGSHLDIGVSGRFDVILSKWRINALLKALTFAVVAGLSLALAREIQRRLLARQASDKAEKRFRAFFERSMVGMATISPQCDWIDVNPALGDILGYSIDELRLTTWQQLIHPQDWAAGQLQFERLLAGESDDFEFDARFNHRQGNTVFIHLAIRAVRKPDRAVDYVVALLEDITERKQAEQEIQHLAFNDALTQLPNRRLLSERLSQAMTASQRTGRYCALLFLDLDNFKPLNDRYGHDAGDALLLEIAARLRRSVRAVDTVSRFGGDEFVVLLSELATGLHESTLQAGAVAEKIRASLSAPYSVTVKHKGQPDSLVEHHCTASIGVVVFMGHEASQDDILKWADDAMYQAKNSGRNLVQFHDMADKV